MNVKCDYCKIEFNRRPSRVKEKNFCSNECRGKFISKQNTISCSCAECGVEIVKTKSQLEKSKSGNVFCSQSCAAVHNNKLFTGTNARNWKEDSNCVDYRKIAFNNKPKICEKCGYNKYEEILQVHHVDHDRENNNIGNLMVLCPNCHAVEHIVIHGSFSTKPV